MIVVPVDESVVVFTVTLHLVPDTRPDSVNFTSNVHAATLRLRRSTAQSPPFRIPFSVRTYNGRRRAAGSAGSLDRAATQGIDVRPLGVREPVHVGERGTVVRAGPVVPPEVAPLEGVGWAQDVALEREPVDGVHDVRGRLGSDVPRIDGVVVVPGVPRREVVRAPAQVLGQAVRHVGEVVRQIDHRIVDAEVVVVV